MPDIPISASSNSRSRTEGWLEGASVCNYPRARIQRFLNLQSFIRAETRESLRRKAGALELAGPIDQRLQGYDWCIVGHRKSAQGRNGTREMAISDGAPRCYRRARGLAVDYRPAYKHNRKGDAALKENLGEIICDRNIATAADAIAENQKSFVYLATPVFNVLRLAPKPAQE